MSVYLLLFITVMAGATFLTRALPFLFVRSGVDHPVMLYIGRYLPPAIMLLLLIYCLKEVTFLKSPYGAPELSALAIVVTLHLLWRNSLISICAGTAFYMFAIQTRFFI